MTIEKQDSNVVGLFVTRETAVRVRPNNPAFVTREPNSFNDIGGDYSTVARRPFSPSRQRRKGTIVDLDAAGGWNEDVTMNNMVSTLEGFCFAAQRAEGRSDERRRRRRVRRLHRCGDCRLPRRFDRQGLRLRQRREQRASRPERHYRRNAYFDGRRAGGRSGRRRQERSRRRISVPGGRCSIAVVGGVARLTSAAIDLYDVGA
jgi:hypothetical protein